MDPPGMQKRLAGLGDRFRRTRERKRLETLVVEAREAHRLAVAAAQQRLWEAETGHSIVILSAVRLTPYVLWINGRTYPLSQSTMLRLDVDGKVQAVVQNNLSGSRMAAGALIGGKAGLGVGALAQKSAISVQDMREVYLTAMDSSWSEVARLWPSEIEGTRRLLAAAEVAIRNLPTARAHQAYWVQEARKYLDWVHGDTNAIHAAESALQGYDVSRRGLPS